MTDICSIWAYHDILESGKVSRLHGMYLSVFSENNEPLTMNQAIIKFKEKFKDFPYKTHHGMGSRISELTDKGFLKKFDMVRCDLTRKTVNRWIYTGKRESKRKIVVKMVCSHCKGCGSVDKVFYAD